MNPRRSSRKSPSHASIEEPARKQQNEHNAKFPIVGIGASAGGLEAFSELLKNLPIDTGMAFVLIQHLNPDYQSLLSEILGRITLLPVSEVTEGVAVEPNRVYIIPPNTQMFVSQGNLRLTPREKIKGKYMPIDFFFRSLALEWESKAIAVVLSGLDGDGALGLEAVKAAGGITFAQDSATAKFDGMPHSAVATGSVDFILPPASIARELAKISQYPYVNRSTSTPTEERAESEDSLLQIFAMLLSATGVDFTYYKHATLRRRIKRQMVIHNRENLSDYVTYLQENPAEIEVLYQDMLIHVTSFFRDPGTFEALKTQVFPIITQGKSLGTPIRIWIPGCSTGEEAYSIAICLLEFLEDRRSKPAIQIFATDISETVIEKARASIYKQNLLSGV
ncbi:MAG: ATPase, partial [Nostocaceae cyanobacterium]|nr:ATPase [Nostocaceae cyanobacterium]